MNNIHEDNRVVEATILIVEDHESVRSGLRNWLSVRFPECRILVAKSGEEAVALVNGQPPDIVLMDIELPEMNGIEATRRVKAIAPLVRIVILTVHAASQYRDAATKAGADIYISKHRMNTELIPAVAGLLGQSSDTDTVA